MSKQLTTDSQRSRPSVLTLFLIAVSTMILASCGGGGSDSTSSAESADGTKQALGVSSTAATVPGGWTGRAPKMEIINGITVPPEPAPAINNATLAGVDVNANGVRDDVERRLAKYVSMSSWNQAISYAKLLETALKDSPPTTRQAALGYYKKLQCFGFDGDGKLIRYPGNTSIVGITFNTPARASALSNYAVLVGGYDDEEVSCE